MRLRRFYFWSLLLPLAVPGAVYFLYDSSPAVREFVRHSDIAEFFVIYLIGSLYFASLPYFLFMIVIWACWWRMAIRAITKLMFVSPLFFSVLLALWHNFDKLLNLIDAYETGKLSFTRMDFLFLLASPLGYVYVFLIWGIGKIGRMHGWLTMEDSPPLTTPVCSEVSTEARPSPEKTMSQNKSLSPWKAALVQMNSGGDAAENLERLAAAVKEAADAGADWVMTPENTLLMSENAAGLATEARQWREHQNALAALARANGIWLLVGSVPVWDEKAARTRNRCLLFDPSGALQTHYDKLHLFDVTLPGGERYDESARYIAGDKPVLAETPWGAVGLSICYDLRFPALYRHYAMQGAPYLTVPSAFTRTTGRTHWHALLRARAIETGSYVFAPAQCGSHPAGRETYGHSLLIDPWGEIIAEAGEEPEVIYATIDPARVEDTRRRIPSLTHGVEIDTLPSCASGND